jgi:hypothetical protein
MAKETLDEAALRKVYPHIVADSLKDATKRPGRFLQKRTVEIKCAYKGCDVVRRIATSDLAQVKFCKEHTRQLRLQRRRDARVTKKVAKAK